MSSKMKLEKVEQTYKMKKQNIGIANAKREKEKNWDFESLLPFFEFYF